MWWNHLSIPKLIKNTVCLSLSHSRAIFSWTSVLERSDRILAGHVAFSSLSQTIYEFSETVHIWFKILGWKWSKICVKQKFTLDLSQPNTHRIPCTTNSVYARLQYTDKGCRPHTVGFCSWMLAGFCYGCIHCYFENFPVEQNGVCVRGWLSV